jgi:CHAT domain-containing protein
MSRPRLHWCPTGAFVFVPLHAAGIYYGENQECCSDYVVSSYTPTLAALLRAQKTSFNLPGSDLTVALISANKGYDIDLPVLYNVNDEIHFISTAAEKSGVSINADCVRSPATVSRVSDTLESATMAHIACHGIQNASDALASGFCLADGNLTVSRLMDLDLKNAFFAFLSACETAKGDKKHPDQTVHLAAAMLFVGFRSVVATMW